MATEPELSLDQLIELERRAAAREVDEAAGPDQADEGDVIVLPWWQRPFNIGVLVVTAAVMAGLIGWMVGDSGAQVKYADADVGFLQDMREHHEQAVFMSLIYGELADTDAQVGTVARTIARGQSVEVGRMVQLLRLFDADEARSDPATVMDWMSDGDHDHGAALDPADYDDAFSAMPGMATSAQLDALAASSGAAADALFVELMIAHHAAGIEMAEYAVEHARNDEVVAFAASMAHSQGNEIIELEKLGVG